MIHPSMLRLEAAVAGLAGVGRRYGCALMSLGNRDKVTIGGVAAGTGIVQFRIRSGDRHPRLDPLRTIVTGGTGGRQPHPVGMVNIHMLIEIGLMTGRTLNGGTGCPSSRRIGVDQAAVPIMADRTGIMFLVVGTVGEQGIAQGFGMTVGTIAAQSYETLGLVIHVMTVPIGRDGGVTGGASIRIAEPGVGTAVALGRGTGLQGIVAGRRIDVAGRAARMQGIGVEAGGADTAGIVAGITGSVSGDHPHSHVVGVTSGLGGVAIEAADLGASLALGDDVGNRFGGIGRIVGQPARLVTGSTGTGAIGGHVVQAPDIGPGIQGRSGGVAIDIMTVVTRSIVGEIGGAQGHVQMVVAIGMTIEIGGMAVLAGPAGAAVDRGVPPPVGADDSGTGVLVVTVPAIVVVDTERIASRVTGDALGRILDILSRQGVVGMALEVVAVTGNTLAPGDLSDILPLGRGGQGRRGRMALGTVVGMDDRPHLVGGRSGTGHVAVQAQARPGYVPVGFVLGHGLLEPFIGMMTDRAPLAGMVIRAVDAHRAVGPPVVGHRMADLTDTVRRSGIGEATVGGEKLDCAETASLGLRQLDLGPDQLAVNEGKGVPLVHLRKVTGHSNGGGVGGDDLKGLVGVVGVGNEDKAAPRPGLLRPCGGIRPVGITGEKRVADRRGGRGG